MFGPPLFLIFLFGPLVLGPHPPPLLQASVSPPGTKGGDTLTCGLRDWGGIWTTGEILLTTVGIGAPIYWRTDVPSANRQC